MFFKCRQEDRISALETWKIETTKDIQSLLDKLDSSTWWTRALVITLLPLILTAFAYLILIAFGNEVR